MFWLTCQVAGLSNNVAKFDFIKDSTAKTTESKVISKAINKKYIKLLKITKN